MDLRNVGSTTGLELELEGLVLKDGLDVLGSGGSRTGRHCELLCEMEERINW